jgi:hypothetical protein
MDSRGGFALGPLGFLAVVIKVAEVAAKAGIRIR